MSGPEEAFQAVLQSSRDATAAMRAEGAALQAEAACLRQSFGTLAEAMLGQVIGGLALRLITGGYSQAEAAEAIRVQLTKAGVPADRAAALVDEVVPLDLPVSPGPQRAM